MQSISKQAAHKQQQTLPVALLLLSWLLAACAIQSPLTSPPSTETPCEAILTLDSLPQGASAFVDDTFIGHTPLHTTVTCGTHRLTLERQGYALYRTSFEASCGQAYSLSPRLLDISPPTIHMEPVPPRITAEEGLKIIAQATDNEGVASMALLLDETPLFETQEGSLRYNIDTRLLALGAHQGYITARDTAGHTSVASFSFEIAVPPTMPPIPSPVPSPTASPTMLAPTSLPTPAPSPTPLPPPQVVLYETEITLTLYDYERALYTAPDQVGHPYPLLRHDQVGPPTARAFRAIVMRNEYLEVILLPELGGRIYQCRFLPTGQNLLYNNQAAKPTHWGPADQGWWLALGGIEFALPVEEHGYLTAQPWEANLSHGSDGSATVHLRILEQTRWIEAHIEVTLRPQEAAIHLRTTLENQSNQTQAFQYWINAMLSPGSHGVGPSLRLIVPTNEVIVHSTGDPALPGAGAPMPWPYVDGRDLSRYGAWRNWLGFFAPNLAAPFAAVYDEAAEIGMVHVFPPEVMRGTKLFGFGRDFDHHLYADDNAAYVELWGGLTPTFSDNITLAPGEQIRWEETWYVIARARGVHFANSEASVYAKREGEKVHLVVASPGRREWRLVLSQAEATLADQTIVVRPEAPFEGHIPLNAGNMGAPLRVRILTDAATILDYTFEMP